MESKICMLPQKKTKRFKLKEKTLSYFLIWVICKPRHWNLGIGLGIEIGTDIANAIISSFIRPMDPRFCRVVT